MDYSHIAAYIIAAGQRFIIENDGDEKKADDIFKIREAVIAYDCAAGDTDTEDDRIAAEIDALDTIASYLA
jgi:hypothetical protein